MLVRLGPAPAHDKTPVPRLTADTVLPVPAIRHQAAPAGKVSRAKILTLLRRHRPFNGECCLGVSTDEGRCGRRESP